MEWFSTLTLALGTAWTSGINLYATVSVIGLLQKFSTVDLPGGLDVLDNWWIIGFASGLYLVEFVADKVPYVDSIWDVVHTFIRVPAGALMAYGASNQLDPTFAVIIGMLGGGFALSSHGTKAALRAGTNLSPEPFSNWTLSVIEDAIAFIGVLLAVFAPVIIAIVLIVVMLATFFLAPYLLRAIRKLLKAARSLFRGRPMEEVLEEAP